MLSPSDMDPRGQGHILPVPSWPPTSLHLCLSHAKWLTPASPGIQTTVVFWPAKLQVSERVVMFRFEFWDCGESALKKFDHMLPVSRQVGLGGSRRGWLSQVGPLSPACLVCRSQNWV